MNIQTICQTIYQFKSIKLRQYRYDKDGNYLHENKNIETTVSLQIKDKCFCLFLTEHKFIIISWLMMVKKLPNMFNQLSYYCS